jgi:type I restriction enzyme S subunit
MCLQSDFLQRQISVGTAQLAQGNLFQGAIRKLVIPMPSIDEQIQIASVVKQFSATRSVWMNHMETTRELRKSLLKSFLTSKSQQI